MKRNPRKLNHGDRHGPVLPKTLGWLLGALLSWGEVVEADGPPADPADGYRDQAQLAAALKKLAVLYPEHVQLEPIGQSGKGAAIWGLTLAAKAEVTPEERPALLIAAGLDGAHILGSEVALKLAERLLEAAAAGKDPKAQALLLQHTVYVLPRINVDGQELFFQKPRRERQGNLPPLDDDRDGAADEDGPEDLNGDGVITAMRVKDPEGEWIPDENDPRLLRQADRAKGEAGMYKIYTEGIDSDGDGEINEDGADGADLNRNFPQDYLERSPGAGPHEVSEPESRALADFVVRHGNIALSITFGLHDNISGDPKVQPAWAGGPDPGTIDGRDKPYFDGLRQRLQEILKLKAGGPAANGAFFHWLYQQRGIFSMATPLWQRPELPPVKESEPAKEGDPAKTDKDKEREKKKYPDTDDGRWLEYSDKQRGGGGFVNWTPFNHPTLGPVEIGGFVPYFKTTPPAEAIPAIAEAQYAALLELAARFPAPRWEDLKVRQLGEGIFEVQVQLANGGFLPVLLGRGQSLRQAKPVRVRLEVPADKVLSGERQALVYDLPGSGGRRKFRWLVRGKPGESLKLSASSPATGRAAIDIPLTGEKKP